MFKIIVGCYEQLVLGYTVFLDPQSTKGELLLKWKTHFSDHSQLGCIRCIASNNLIVASGSSDESICLYDLKNNCQLGTLQSHDGSVNDIVLPDEKHLVSCGDDGNIFVWDIEAGGKLLKTLRGHTGAVLSFAMHPSGKLGMSTSLKDGSLRTWNMINGRSAYVRNTKKSRIEFVTFSPDGDYYVTASTRFVQIYELDKAKCCKELETKYPILALQCLPQSKASIKRNFLAVGDSAGNICIYTIPTGFCTLKYKAHENRVKSICPFIPNAIEVSVDDVWMISVSSDEKIKMWKFNTTKLLEAKEMNDTADCILTIDTSARLTCVTVWQKPLEDDKKGDAKDDTGKVCQKVDESKVGINIEKNLNVKKTTKKSDKKINLESTGETTANESKRGRKRERSSVKSNLPSKKR